MKAFSFIRSIPRRLGFQDPPRAVVNVIVSETFQRNLAPITAIHGAVGPHTLAHLYAEVAAPLRKYIVSHYRKHGVLPEGWHRLRLDARPLSIVSMREIGEAKEAAGFHAETPSALPRA